MTSVERTAYPRFTRAPSVKELREIYTPTPTDVAFVATTARGPAQKFGLMILLKVYQRLGYFPKPETIPGAIISHIRAVMKLPADLVPDIASNHTLYRYYAAIREHLEIQSEGKHIRHVAAQAMRQAAQVMENPADLISAAIEVLVKEQCELPGFSTLERMAGASATWSIGASTSAWLTGSAKQSSKHSCDLLREKVQKVSLPSTASRRRPRARP